MLSYVWAVMVSKCTRINMGFIDLGDDLQYVLAYADVDYGNAGAKRLADGT